MTEQKIHRFNPETGKPNPVSFKEYTLMDRHEQRAFSKPLSKKERFAFHRALLSVELTIPLAQRRELATEKVDKLSQRNNSSIGDKLELGFAKLQLAHVTLAERPPIFFRKLRIGGLKFPKWLTEKKSSYLIGA